MSQLMKFALSVRGGGGPWVVQLRRHMFGRGTSQWHRSRTDGWAAPCCGPSERGTAAARPPLGPGTVAKKFGKCSLTCIVQVVLLPKPERMHGPSGTARDGGMHTPRCTLTKSCSRVGVCRVITA